MWYAAYTLALTLAAPPAAFYLFANSRHRPLLRRFRPAVPSQSAPPIWLHACSVGEVRTAVPYLEALRTRWPDVPLVLTVSTRSGGDLAQEIVKDAAVTLLPFDHPWIVRRFVQRLKPRALLILETELWPALIRETAAARVPVAILNGRLSDKHFARYTRWRGVLRPFIAQIRLFCVQNAEYAGRYLELGAQPDRVNVVGNAKFDGAPAPISPAELHTFRAECGFAPDAPILVFGSIRPGDEFRAAECWRDLRERFPQLHLVVAPRHLDRLEAVVKPFDEPVSLRSHGSEPAESRVLCVDTFGELVRFYALATVAVVGGSFDPEVQGHNPIEPAALGTPTIFGPHMRNFTEPARQLVEAGAALQVQNTDGLLNAIRELLHDESRRSSMAEAARSVVLQNQGAIAHTIALLTPLIGNGK